MTFLFLKALKQNCKKNAEGLDKSKWHAIINTITEIKAMKRRSSDK